MTPGEWCRAAQDRTRIIYVHNGREQTGTLTFWPSTGSGAKAKVITPGGSYLSISPDAILGLCE